MNQEPKWIHEDAVPIIHSYLLELFGGPSGVRNQGGLDSALERPKNLFAYEEPSIFELATAYVSGIVRNHPFVDGNKRTGLAIGLTFLEQNGYEFFATEEEATAMTIGLAASEIDEVGFAEWLELNSTPTKS